MKESHLKPQTSASSTPLLTSTQISVTAATTVTPIRWGNASSLYYHMVQRMNCVQNQSITHESYLI
jgi:hypothetical protein